METEGHVPRNSRVLSVSWGDPQACQLGTCLVLGKKTVSKERLPREGAQGGPAPSPPPPSPQSRPSPLGAQGQVELADGLQELPLQRLVSHPPGQGQLELVVDDTLGLAGLDRAVEVTQLLDRTQLAWAGDERKEPLSCTAATFAGSEVPCRMPASSTRL